MRAIALILIGCLGLWVGPACGAESSRAIKIGKISEMNHAGGRLGTYRALIIGINDYQDPKIPDLKTACNDAREMGALLSSMYGFKVKLLLDGQATRKAIYTELRELTASAQEHDSILIYYAGHGDLDRTYNDGWWIPYDARGGDPLTYLDNSQIQKAMRAMQARHVLLISDSCYSGTLFGEARSLPPVIDNKYYVSLYNEKSRWGMTSGNKTPVSDAGSGGHSVFAYQLLNTLRNNTQPFISTQELYTRIAPVVSNNSEQTPLCRPIRNTGDQGGEFVFVAVENPVSKPASLPPSKAAQPTRESQQSAIDKETLFWQAIQKSDDPALFMAYLDQFPDGVFVAVAKARIAALRPETPPAVQETQASETTVTVNGVSFKMMQIKAGTFVMGSPANEPGRDDGERQHRVTLTRDYWMGATEVTQALWQAVMGGNPSNFKNCGGDCPVEQVSWDDCREFIRRLNGLVPKGGFRLPTEAEWEYATRAGSTDALANGGISVQKCGHDANLEAMGWYCGNSDNSTHPVAQKQANRWGLYDMHGNVWEWCQDWYGDYSTGPASDPTGSDNGSHRVNRGGSWNYGARFCRSAARAYSSPDGRSNLLGFRLARTN